MTQPRQLQAVPEFDQVAPSQPVRDRTTESLAHPDGHVARPPVLILVLVVTLGNLADPIGAVANHRRKYRGCPALGQQPQDLPPGPFARFFGRAVAVFEFVNAQIRLEMNASCHGPILPQPRPVPYEDGDTRYADPPLNGQADSHRDPGGDKGSDVSIAQNTCILISEAMIRPFSSSTEPYMALPILKGTNKSIAIIVAILAFLRLENTRN
jgi:hypothetical protein